MGIEVSASGVSVLDVVAGAPVGAPEPIVSPTPIRESVYPRPGKGNPLFQEWSDLGTAVHDVTCSVRGVKFGGGTARAGWVLKMLLADHLKTTAGKLFGNYRPSDVKDTVLDPTFKAKATAKLEAWQKGWDADVTADTIKARKAQMVAASAFFTDPKSEGFDKVAKAIDTILAKSAAGSVQFKDAATNNRPIGLVGMLDLVMSINLTPSRLAKLGLGDND